MVFRAFLTLCMGASLFIGGAALTRQSGATSGGKKRRTEHRY